MPKKKFLKVNIKLSDLYQIAELDSFSKLIQKKQYSHIYKKIKNYIYPQLRKNPFFGLNIKKLKGSLDSFYRYRIGDYRLFYKIDSDKVIVFIIMIKHRKDAY
jgi:mRNA interferase RelE/StbE